MTSSKVITLAHDEPGVIAALIEQLNKTHVLKHTTLYFRHLPIFTIGYESDVPLGSLPPARYLPLHIDYMRIDTELCCFNMLTKLICMPSVTTHHVHIACGQTLTRDQRGILYRFIRHINMHTLSFGYTDTTNQFAYCRILNLLQPSKSIHTIYWPRFRDNSIAQRTAFRYAEDLILHNQNISRISGLEVVDKMQFNRLSYVLANSDHSLTDLTIIIDGQYDRKRFFRKSNLTLLSWEQPDGDAEVMSSFNDDFNWIRVACLILSTRANHGNPLLNSMLECVSLVTKQLGYTQSLKRKRISE